MDNNELYSDIFTVDMSLLRNENLSTYSESGMALADNVQTLRKCVKRNTSKGCIRMDLHMIMFCVKGELRYVVNDEPMVANHTKLMIIPAHSIISEVEMSDDAKCLILYMSTAALNNTLGGGIAEWNKFMFFDKIRSISLSKDDMESVNMYYELIKIQMKVKKPYMNSVIQSIVQVALYDILGNFKKSQNADNGSSNQNQIALHSNQLFNQFLELLSSTTPKRHPVKFYADKLAISPKYLTILCKKYSGRTAIEWIHEYVMEEIRYYLMQYKIEINKVADLTGFDNFSFFSRFVKSQVGYTPVAYRKQMQIKSDFKKK